MGGGGNGSADSRSPQLWLKSWKAQQLLLPQGLREPRENYPKYFQRKESEPEAGRQQSELPPLSPDKLMTLNKVRRSHQKCSSTP